MFLHIKVTEELDEDWINVTGDVCICVYNSRGGGGETIAVGLYKISEQIEFDNQREETGFNFRLRYYYLLKEIATAAADFCFKSISVKAPLCHWSLTLTLLRLRLSKAQGRKVFENHLNPVMLVFIGKLLLSSEYS